LEKKPIDAEKTFKKIIELAPENPMGYSRLGFLYLLQKKHEKALQRFAKALRLQPGQREALTYSVSIYLEKKQFDTALTFCEQQSNGLEKDSLSLAFIHDLKGRIYLAHNEIAQAKKSFEKAIEINSDVLFPYIALARIYVSEKDPDSAISKYKDILAKNPSYLPAYMSLGTIYQQKDDIKEAESYYRQVLEIRKDFAPAANNLAWILAEHGGNIDEALGLAQTAKEKMPKDPSIMDTLGWIYYKKGLYRNAIVELEQSHEKIQKNPVILYHLGMAYLKNNQKEEAKAALEKALTLNQKFPGYKEAQKALANME
jgi:tetratricopeptide (TPR) repeat protein